MSRNPRKNAPRPAAPGRSPAQPPDSDASSGAGGAVPEPSRIMEEPVDQRAFLRQILDLNPCFVFAKDRHGRFTLVNRAVAEAYGTTVEQLTGRTDAEFNSNAAEVASFRRDDLHVMDTLQELFIAEEVITDSSGRVRHLQTIKRPIVGPDGRANQVLGISTDITARKMLEERLVQAQKLEAIGRLAGGIAHDFNNLLTVILGSIEVLRAELGSEHPSQPTAAQIQTAAERAATLTRQLVAFSRKQVLRPRVIDLNDLVNENAQMLRRVIGDGIDLATDLRAAGGHVKADPTQLTQVILNLAINARDAMPGGGRLTIGTAEVDLDDAAAAALQETPPGRYVTLEISDTGDGIAPDCLPHLFEPFFTTKPPGRGTGLGLATSYGIVRQSGGHIEIRTETGRGTTFTVYLPRTEENAGPESAAAPATRDRRGTILLVDDEVMIRRVAASALRQAGFGVLEAADGAEALGLAERHPGAIDVLVTDVVMPRMGGIDLAANLARARPETRVLYTSGHSEDLVDAPESNRRGWFLAKPYLPNLLVRRVCEVLEAPARHEPR